MTIKPLTYATIGTSWITADYIASCEETKKWQLTAVYSRNIETASLFSEKNNLPREVLLYDDFAEMVANSGVSTIYIASPNSCHVQQSRFFLQRGFNVICEKPAALCVDDLRELYKIAEEEGVFFFEAFRHIQQPSFGILADAIKTDRKSVV